MRRALSLAVVGALLATASWGWAATRLSSYRVPCTTTRATIVAANATRTRLILQNAVDRHANVGIGTIMLTLHATATAPPDTSRLDLGDYTGHLECEMQGGSAAGLIEVLEILK